MLTIATSSIALAAPTADGVGQPVNAESKQRPLMVGGRDLHAKAGRNVVVKGRGTSGRVVRLQVFDGRWRTLGRDRVNRKGAYRIRGERTTPDSTPGRVVSAGQKRKIGRVNTYRYALASWYGPGLYGNPLGCGGTLHGGTMGVAHKSLPCGTKVTIRHGKNVVRVPVVDRGPYSGAREFDLTAATANALNFSGVGGILVTR